MNLIYDINSNIGNTVYFETFIFIILATIIDFTLFGFAYRQIPSEQSTINIIGTIIFWPTLFAITFNFRPMFQRLLITAGGVSPPIP